MPRKKAQLSKQEKQKRVTNWFRRKVRQTLGRRRDWDTRARAFVGPPHGF